MGSLSSATLFDKCKARKKHISSPNVLHVVQGHKIEKFIVWIACQKPNLGFLANLNPLLKLYEGSRDWRFLMLLKCHLLLVAAHYYMGFIYALSVFVLLVLEYEFQYRIMIKFYINGIFELLKCHYSLNVTSNSVLDLSHFLSNPLWVDVRISSLEKKVSDIIFINFMLMTLSIYDITDYSARIFHMVYCLVIFSYWNSNFMLVFVFGCIIEQF